MLAALLGTLVVVSGLAAPALAADEDISVTIRPLVSGVKSGETMTFEVAWQCGSTSRPQCEGALLEVPVPTGQPDGGELSVESFTAVKIGDQQYPVAVEGSGANRRIVWSFPQALVGSQSGLVTFTLRSKNWTTPDGTTVAPVAHFSSTLARVERASAPVTITSQLGLKITKTQFAPLGDPYVGSDVTFLIRTGYPAQWDATGGFTPYGNICAQPGLWAMRNEVIVDQLPPGTVFKSATRGGHYDSASHTVTWNLGDSAQLTSDGTPRCDSSSFGQDVLVTVNYPEETFSDAANNHELQTNRASVTASPWERPDETLRDNAEASHYLRIGGDGAFTVQKGISYVDSNGQSRGFARGEWAAWGDWVRGSLHAFSVEGSGNATGTWNLVDVLPCVWASPENPGQTDCATPAYTDIAFGATGALSALTVHWVTNTGTEGTCEIPEGFTVGDSEVRLCAGLQESEPIAVGSGEWITKFWLDDAALKAGSKGKLLLFGRVSRDIPLDNSAAVAAGAYQPHFLTTGTAQPTPLRGVTPASEHPLWVTVENCAATNTVTWDGGTMTTDGALVDPNTEGRCGYTRVTRDVLNIWSQKRMYDPDLALTDEQKDSEPSLKPGQRLRVEVVTQRDDWNDLRSTGGHYTFTPTITDILPEALLFDPRSPENPVYLGISGQPNSAAQVIAKLGEPRLTTSEVNVGGVIRTQVVVDFPNAPKPGGLELQQEITVGFDVRVKNNTPAGTAQNYTLVQAAEAAHDYLVCASPGSYADPKQLNPATSWGDLSFDNAVQGPEADTGCRTSKPYTVVEGPGMSSQKAVQGVYDEGFVASPGIGATDATGVAHYRITMANTGNVDTRNVVVYDLLPRVGDTGVRPGAVARGSAFDVFMTGPVTGLPGDTRVEYSKSENPCRGELAGDGGQPLETAPANCQNDWSTALPADFGAITAIRIDFGARVWVPGDQFVAEFPAVAGTGDLTGTA